MSTSHIVLVLLAGVWSGTINSVVGSGTLVTFPILISLGVPPVVATMSNAVGLVPGSITGSYGYRRELAGQYRRLRVLVPASLLGSVCGAWLLLHLPEHAFASIVPVLVAGALLLVVTQPMINRWLQSRRRPGEARSSPVAGAGTAEPRSGRARTVALWLSVFACGIYGGYFAAAQGIMLMGVLGVLVADSLQRLNALKNALALVVNVVAASSYTLVGWDRIDWPIAGLIAAGGTVGGIIGSRMGRRLSPVVLRTCIVALGVVAMYNILRV